MSADLVRRLTDAAARRGHHLMMLRRAETEIAAAETDLEQARQAPARERDVLQDIKRRILGGAA